MRSLKVLGKKWIDFGQYAFFKGIFVLVDWIPSYRLMLILGHWMGLVMHHALGTHRKAGLINTAKVYPGMSLDERKKLVRSACSQMGKTLLDFVKLRRVNRDFMAKRSRTYDLHLLDEALARGKGLIICGMHFGSWYWAALSVALLLGKRIHLFYRPMDNVFLEREMYSKHQGNVHFIAKGHAAYTQIVEALDRNEIVMMMGDITSRQSGIYVPFLGVRALAQRGVSVFYRRTGCAVVVGYGLRDKEGTHHLHVRPLVRSLGDDDKENLIIINETFEPVIRANPEQYFWMQIQWKTQEAYHVPDL